LIKKDVLIDGIDDIEGLVDGIDKFMTEVKI
jgi:hypothetical protein